MSGFPAAIRRMGIGLAVTVAGLFVLAAMLTPDGASAAEPPAGTIPPVAPFVLSSDPSATARSGERITFMIQIRNEMTPVYSAEIGITSTLLVPAPQTLSPQIVHFSSGNAQVMNGELMWTGAISNGAEITIAYAITAPLVVTQTSTITNLVQLYEIRNDFVPTPTNQVTQTLSVVEVQPWRVFLPTVRRAKEILQQLRSPGFEEQADKDAWTELVNGRPGKLIYSISDFYRPLKDGSHYVWLGGARNQINRLEQSVTLSKEYNHIGLRFYYWLYSEEDECGPDSVQVQVGTDVINVPDFLLCKKNGTYQLGYPDGWTQRLLDLSTYRGREVKIAFQSTLNDNSKNSNFLLDRVEICSNDPDLPSGTLPCK